MGTFVVLAFTLLAQPAVAQRATNFHLEYFEPRPAQKLNFLNISPAPTCWPAASPQWVWSFITRADADTDSDNIPNFRDLDSDGDGILDEFDFNQSLGGGTEFLSGGGCTLSQSRTAGGGEVMWPYLAACAGFIHRIRRRHG